jgi:hypothetical protein
VTGTPLAQNFDRNHLAWDRRRSQLNPPDFPADGIVTERVRLGTASRADAEALLAFQIENRAHLQPWEPLRRFSGRWLAMIRCSRYWPNT